MRLLNRTTFSTRIAYPPLDTFLFYLILDLHNRARYSLRHPSKHLTNLSICESVNKLRTHVGWNKDNLLRCRFSGASNPDCLCNASQMMVYFTSCSNICKLEDFMTATCHAYVNDTTSREYLLKDRLLVNHLILIVVQYLLLRQTTRRFNLNAGFIQTRRPNLSISYI